MFNTASRISTALLTAFFMVLSSCMSPGTGESTQPESGYKSLEPTGASTADTYMIAAANPDAVAAGQEIMRRGGSAIDAMVTVQLVLNIVEPESSGIGGGAFLVYYDQDNDMVTALDGRETAPVKVDERLFFQGDERMKWSEAVPGGLSVGTPGTLKLLKEAHERYGNLPWSEVVTPAITLASEGFTVSDKLHTSIVSKQDDIETDAAAREFFLPDGEALAAGQVVRNPDFAKTLTLIRDEGIDAFYTGPIADSIVQAVAESYQPGFLSREDLANYSIVERTPLSFSYRGYDIYGMGAPTSGTITTGQILGILENFDLEDMDYDSPEFLRLFGEASRLAYADRGMYIADPEFFDTPSRILLDKDYLAGRAALIPDAAAGKNILSADEVVPGDLAGFGYTKLGLSPGLNFDVPSTSHISIVDAEGNVVSMTTTIENGFGSKIFVEGFLLNNELTDFSFAYESDDGTKIANRVQPGKRPRSSMGPMIVLKDGKPYMALGSPGGSRIIEYMARNLIAVLDWGYGIQDAVNLPNVANRFGTYDLEEGTAVAALEDELQAMGYETSVRNLFSGSHGVLIMDDGTLHGAADPRREGIARGE